MTDFDLNQHRLEKIRRLEAENRHLRAHRVKLERIISLAVPLDVIAQLERHVDADARLEEVLAWVGEGIA